MDKEEFIEYKKARLLEISKVIKESSERLNPQPMGLDEIQERLEKLKNDHPWLRGG
jgi:hypothetical protein